MKDSEHRPHSVDETADKYRETWFRIRSAYGGGSGWPDDASRTKFRDETRRLFREAGWTLQPGRSSGVCDTVTKGQEELYLHPMSFSGIIRESSIPRLKALFDQAATFQCYAVDRYKEFLPMSDEENQVRLEGLKDEITAELLKRYQTKRSDLYITGSVALSIAERFAVPRLVDREQRHGQEITFVTGLVQEMLQDGRLIAAQTRHGEGIRAAAPKELQTTEQLTGQVTFQQTM